MAVLTNQMLVYKHRRVIPRLVIPRIESIAKMPVLYTMLDVMHSVILSSSLFVFICLCRCHLGDRKDI